jgi:ADP-ribose pyrophosphatase YjhB (NUDIX family)
MLEHTQAGDRWIPEPEYRFICDRVPILCVDVLPLVENGRRFALIRRETYDGGTGLNLVGGGVLLDEPLDEALRRHLRATLGESVELELETLRMVGVYQYFRDEREGQLHDPRKNAVSVTYSAGVSGRLEACGEALDVCVFDTATPPPLTDFGFGQGSVVYDALAQLGRPADAEEG